MAWPTAQVNTTNMDANGDSPLSARSDILDLTTKFNELIAMRGVANGVASLGANGKVPSAQISASLVMLSTPEAITANTVGTWTTINNTTLANAGATIALIKLTMIASSGSGAVTAYALGEYYLRTTGSGLAADNSTVMTRVAAYCSVVNEVVNDNNHAVVPIALDGNGDFDYYLTDQVNGGSITKSMYLMGYWVP